MKDQLDAVGKQLDQLEPSSEAQKESLQKAKEELLKGLVLIAARQKRIKIADRSEFGWGTVDEYEEDELASDDDDIKRLEKAEKVAATKATKKRKMAPQRSAGYSNSYKSQQQRLQDRTPLPTVPRAPMPGPPGVPPLLPPGRPPRMPGPCFHCGEMGHLRVSCPKLSRQQYPLSSLARSASVNKPGGSIWVQRKRL